MKPLSGDRNQCAGCKKYFNSTAAFDKHRTGQFGVDRRCKTTEEMIADGMSQRSDDFWVGTKMPVLLQEKYREKNQATDPAQP
jgi:hypothetical protein